MTTGGDERHEGWLKLSMLDEIGADVTDKMMHSDYGLSGSKSYGLSRGHAHEKSADESGTHGYSHQVDIIQSNSGFLKGSLQNSVDVLQMVARSNLRYYAAVVFEYIYLRGDDVRENLSPVSHHGDGRLIAGCFYSKCQKFVIFHSSLPFHMIRASVPSYS